MGIELSGTAPPTNTFTAAEHCITSHGGIFAPFEQSYAEFDIKIIHEYVETFKSVIFGNPTEYVDESYAVYQAWTGAIARTRIGVYLAHIMKSQLIAFEAGTFVSHIIRPDGAYQGSVIHGENIQIRLVGKTWVEAGDSDALVKDLAECGAHTKAIAKILELAGLVASEPSQFGSLRELSQAVNAGGTPAGMQMNLIQKQLANLAFEERPTPVNADSIIHTMELLSSDDIIPPEMYMDKGFFFPKGRFEEVLCRFGTSAPSFHPGGNTEIRCCSILGRGVPDSLKYDRAAPPTYLQSHMIPIAVCSNQWNDVLHHGHLKGTFDRKTSNGRVWGGEEKKRLWEALDDRVRPMVIEKGKPAPGVVAAGGSGTKRAIEDEAVTVETRAKKLSKFF